MAESDDDFAALFAASTQAKRFEKGQTLEGRIVAIRADVAFVDVGGKGEATIDIKELQDADGRLEAAVGDRIEALVVSTASGLTLSRRLARSAATERLLEDAYRTGLPVEGRVERAVKGGYDVRFGRQRAFCPMSQIDIVKSDAATHEGHVYEFRITEYRNGGRSIVVSRRALLEAARRAEADDVRRSLQAGAVVTGRVASVRDFGAFIDLGGGVQGLLHVSEMGWSRVLDAGAMVKPGDEITVKVLRVDDKTQRIALGLKQLTDDPWSRVRDTYSIGQLCSGRVTRVTDFGAFVELAPGIEALAHVSTFEPGRRSDARSAALEPGACATFQIVSLDLDKKRIGVALAQTASEAIEAEQAREYGEREPPAERFGTLADVLRGALEPRRK